MTDHGGVLKLAFDFVSLLRIWQSKAPKNSNIVCDDSHFLEDQMSCLITKIEKLGRPHDVKPSSLMKGTPRITHRDRRPRNSSEFLEFRGNDCNSGWIPK
jgi:hypothetical protein